MQVCINTCFLHRISILCSFTYVTDVIVKVIGYISKAKAHTITVEAHSTGQALILSTWKAKAEMYCEGMLYSYLCIFF